MANTTESRDLPQQFEVRESYTHKFAKELLRGWIMERRSIKILNVVNGYKIDFCYLEYPVIDGIFPYLHDEFPTKSCQAFKGCGYREYDEVYCPCMKCGKLKGKVLAVADIATAHEGAIIDVVEVAHKNGLSDLKRDIYEKHHPLGNVYVVSAQHILGQIERPDRLECIEII